MGQGVSKVYTVTMASGGTLTSELNLSRSYQNMYLVVPSMTSNTQFHLQSCDVTGGTYRRVTHPSINSSTVTVNDFAIASSVTNRCVPMPNGVQFLKVESTATVDNGLTFKIICGD